VNFDTRRVLLTGATGGIGRAMARRLLEEGAHVLLVARDAEALELLQRSLAFAGDRVHTLAADLTQPSARALLCGVARQWHGGVDVLINNAGCNAFAMFEDLTAEQLEQCFAVNVLAPMHLCRELLPSIKARESAMVVNIGSVFGSIGHPGYAAYSATKFALRGFSEALRRELADTHVGVKYLAPRATRTAMNSASAEQLNLELGVAMDPPERVALELVALLKSSATSAVIGWPEKLFVKVNALLPGIVDRALRAKLSLIRAFSRRTPIALEISSHEHQDIAV
jgi:short-subunit dehydrogenase